MNVEPTDIATAIKLAINSKTYEAYPRRYLGMSQIGHACARNLWMYFRWAAKTKHKAKNQRIFDRGNLEEPRVIGYWKDIGIRIESTQEEVVGCNGHFVGHTDGRLYNLPEIEDVLVVGEVKSMAEKYFKPLTKKGLKDANFAYYVQAQMYMHHEQSKFCLHSTTNKNTEDLHIELIPYDQEVAELYVAKANDIINSNVPPAKISTDPTYFQCTWCDFYGPCQLDDNFLRTCRTCQSASPGPNGTWECYTHNKVLTIEEQKTACTKYDCLKV